MYFTGFADEASKTLDGQINATKELGWSHFEARHIDGKQIYDLSDGDFENLVQKLDDSGVKINCLGSAICNWGKSIESPDAFDIMIGDIDRAIPRMQRLDIKLVRVMSYAVISGRDADNQMQDKRFEHLRELAKRFNAAGITPLHENCMNYGGMSWQHTLRLIENVPGLKLVFDTGNPVGLDDYSKPKPYPKQSSREFYMNVREHIEYIHIKDCKWDKDKNDAIYTFPGEGDADIRFIIKDMLSRRYDGGISIEPHMSVVFHDNSVKSDEDAMYKNYIDYGKKLMSLVNEITQTLNLKD